jgi:hypothetical protein
VVEPGFVFGGVETFLDSPAGTCDTDQLCQVGVGGAVTEVVRDLFWVGDRAAGQQPVPSSRFAPPAGSRGRPSHTAAGPARPPRSSTGSCYVSFQH